MVRNKNGTGGEGNGLLQVTLSELLNLSLLCFSALFVKPFADLADPSDADFKNFGDYLLRQKWLLYIELPCDLPHLSTRLIWIRHSHRIVWSRHRLNGYHL